MSAPPTTTRPRIGVSACFMHADDERPIFKGKTLLYAEESMLRWVQSGGALPYVIPSFGAGLDVADYVADLDGLLLEGGADVCPRTYGEEPRRPQWEGDEIRDRYEIALVRAFLAAGKPVLGVCRGAQLLNVAFGGTLHQDITEQVDGALVHRDITSYDRNLHTIAFTPGSVLGALAASGPEVTVNSVHHQSVDDVGAGLVVEARSIDDGVIEALRWDTAEGWALAVQWHPEFMFDVLPALDEVRAVGAPPLLDNGPILAAFVARAHAARSEPATIRVPEGRDRPQRTEVIGWT